MTRPWQNAEERAARALGGRRVRRKRFESAPDVTLPAGWVGEVKHRARLPRVLTLALEQVERYVLRGFGQRPVVLLFGKGDRRPLAVTYLDDFAPLVNGPGRRVGAREPQAALSPCPTPLRAAGGAPGGRAAPPSDPGIPPCRCAVCIAEGRSVTPPSPASAGKEQKEPA